MEIRLTQGQVALIEDEDYEAISHHSWHAVRRHDNRWYAQAVIAGERIPMAVFLLQPPKGQEVDHRNNDGLDNRRNNLRHCTHQQNLCNRRIFKTNTSGFKGVYRYGLNWRARLKHNSKWVNLGCFRDRIDAARAYNDAALRYFGEFARLNEIPSAAQNALSSPQTPGTEGVFAQGGIPGP